MKNPRYDANDDANQDSSFGNDESNLYSTHRSIVDAGQFIAKWSVTALPGCNAIAVSHDAYVSPDHRCKGIGTREHENRIAWAKAQGAKVMICTVRQDNWKQRYILAKHQWRKILEFTGNDGKVEMWFRDLAEQHAIQSI